MCIQRFRYMMREIKKTFLHKYKCIKPSLKQQNPCSNHEIRVPFKHDFCNEKVKGTVSNDQELTQTEPRFCPRNQNEKQSKLQIDITKRMYG